MGRSESKQAFQQSQATAAQDQANAQAALGQTNAAVTNYNNNLKNFMRFGRSTYGANGEFAKTTNAQATQAAAAGSRAMEGDLALNRMRTGENTAAYASAVGEERRKASQDMTNTEVNANADRLNKLASIEQTGLQASQFPVGVYQSLYGQGVSGANGQQASATDAAKTPGFWDQMAGSLVQGAATVGAAFCPCRDSLIEMADQTRKPVQAVTAGEHVWSLGFSQPPNPIEETPTPRMEHCYEIVTSSGLRHRASATHTVALATGGYGHMNELKDKVVMVRNATDVVVEVIDIGMQEVYPMAVGGSHCYMADGFWIYA